MGSIQTGYLKTKNGNQLFTTVPYPVGAIYLSVDATEPSKLFGGTWERMSGGYLYGVEGVPHNSEYTGGGTQPCTLTVAQIPNHHHISRNWFAGYSGWNTATSDNNAYVFNWGGDGVIVNHNSSNYTGQIKLSNSGNTTSTGGTQSHTHDIAFIGIYMWKRIA